MKIGILGAAGRMGQMIAKEILSQQYNAVIGAAVEHDKSWALGKGIGEIVGGGTGSANLKVTSDKLHAFQTCDVMIDFTNPEATLEHAALADQYQKRLVVGTTGLTAVEEAALHVASKKTAVFYTANMSIGVNILMALVEQVAQKLNDDFDIEIFEAHHRHKVDAPSGTALGLGNAAAKGRGIKLNDAMIPARFGNTGERIKGSIGMSVFRGGDVIGDHTVTFAGMGERLELTHKASDRAIFAKGAVKAALWLHAKPPALYSMRDLLEL
jgi:4-hydroxy-tetrahydrodipicolinate reductase